MNMATKNKIVKALSIIVVLLILLVLVGGMSEVFAQPATSTASATPTATPTATPDTLPDAGVSMPTILGMAIGIIAIFFSLALAL